MKRYPFNFIIKNSCGIHSSAFGKFFKIWLIPIFHRDFFRLSISLIKTWLMLYFPLWCHIFWQNWCSLKTFMVFIHSDVYQPFKCQIDKMVKHTQTIRRQQPTNCLSMFDHFVGLAVKGLKMLIAQERSSRKFLKNNLECLSFWSTYIFYTFAFIFFLKKTALTRRWRRSA